MLGSLTGQILNHHPPIPDIPGQALIAQGQLPDRDGWGASVDVRPPHGLAMRRGQLGHRLLDQHRIEQVACGPELGRVPLPGVGAVLTKHGADGRGGSGRNPACPIEQPLMDVFVLGVNVMEVRTAALTHLTALPYQGIPNQLPPFQTEPPSPQRPKLRPCPQRSNRSHTTDLHAEFED